LKIDPSTIYTGFRLSYCNPLQEITFVEKP
jgi:hypothetical protein